VSDQYILGISAYYHDSAAAIVSDGAIVAAAQEERFTRLKHDHGFPTHAINYCLAEAGLSGDQLSAVAFYDKPWTKFERLLETYLAFAPQGLPSFMKAMPLWLKEKLWMGELIAREVGYEGELMYPEHHQSHAASAFFPSPYERAAILTMDGVGEWATTSLAQGSGNTLLVNKEIHFPHSIGLLYSAFTYYTGFRVNSGEYKLMGLAPYGEPKYVDLILDKLLDLKPDGTFRLDMRYFNYATGLTMTNREFDRLFGAPARKPETPISQREMDIARSIQEVTEEVVLRLARTVHQELGNEYLCLAGGVALNCVANGRVLREGPFKDIWIQPAAGDAGGALGAALVAWHDYHGEPRIANGHDTMRGSYLGPRYGDAEIEAQLDKLGAVYRRMDDAALPERLSEILAAENVVGWFQGRMEFGPRALGGRSIIGDPRSEKMQSVMNLKIKYRESFRPFAPAVLAEDVQEYFELDRPSPYMLIVAPVRESLRIPMSAEQQQLFGVQKLHVKRSQIPAITHVDYSARVQTVHVKSNPRFYALLERFKARTGCAVLVNTSFNVRGEPIVCTPEDAYRCFMRTEMDYLVLGSFLVDKKDQPEWSEKKDWRETFVLD